MKMFAALDVAMHDAASVSGVLTWKRDGGLLLLPAELSSREGRAGLPSRAQWGERELKAEIRRGR